MHDPVIVQVSKVRASKREYLVSGPTFGFATTHPVRDAGRELLRGGFGRDERVFFRFDSGAELSLRVTQCFTD